MKKLLALFLTVLMLLSILAGCGKTPDETAVPEPDAPETEAPAAAQSTVYVSPDGDDSADGTKDAPLATLDGARLRVRSLLPDAKEPITVYFRGGDYYLDKGVVFDEADSGTETSPVTYKAYEGEVVRFLGGKKVDPEKIAPADDAFKARLNDENARAALLMADVSGYVDVYTGIYCEMDINSADFLPIEVYLGNDALVLSRWPNWEGRDHFNYAKILTAETISIDVAGSSLHQMTFDDDTAVRMESWSDESLRNMYVSDRKSVV